MLLNKGVTQQQSSELIMLLTDLRKIYERDPAARNWLEVLFCYPGLQAILCHRVAHSLYQMGVPFIPRLISHLTRFLTGIEIDAGAKIGKGVFSRNTSRLSSSPQKSDWKKVAKCFETS